jgi:hypothetical protein
MQEKKLKGRFLKKLQDQSQQSEGVFFPWIPYCSSWMQEKKIKGQISEGTAGSKSAI